MTKIIGPKGVIHTISHETVSKIADELFHGATRITPIERKIGITHNSMLFHIDRMFRAELISTDKKSNLSLTKRGTEYLLKSQEMKELIEYDSHKRPSLTRAEYDLLYRE